MHISCKPQLGEILNAARVGQVCATTNAGIMIDVDGVQMGSICQTSEKKSHILTCTIECFDGEEKIGLFEIISKHGEVLFAFENCEAGTYEFQLNGISDPSYILARTFGENDSPYTMNQQDVKNHAISNPVYLHPEGFKFQQVTTSLELQFEEGSPWLDGALEIQNSKGKTLVSYAEITSNMHIKHNVPASAKVVLTKADQEKSFWIAMENLKVQELLAYIWQGKFLEDYPSYSYGEVPPEAFDIHKMRQALQNFKRIL